MLTSIVEISELLRKRELSPVELTKQCLERIEKLNSTLNAFITVTSQSALEQARTAEKEMLQGHWRGPLHGIPRIVNFAVIADDRTAAIGALMQVVLP